MTRPRIHIHSTPIDRIMDLLAISLLVGQWVLVATHFSQLPATIPIHFDATGTADGFGAKRMLFLDPALASVLVVGISVVSRFPHTFHFPVPITPENAQKQYDLAVRWLRYFKVVISGLFTITCYQTIQHATGNSNSFGDWFLPLTLGLIFVPILWVVVRSVRWRKG